MNYSSRIPAKNKQINALIKKFALFLLSVVSLTGFGYLWVDKIRAPLTAIFVFACFVLCLVCIDVQFKSLFTWQKVSFFAFTVLIGLSIKWSYDADKTYKHTIYFALFTLVLLFQFSEGFALRIVKVLKATAVFEAITVIISVVMGSAYLSVFGFLYADTAGVWRVLRQGIGTGITGAPAYSAFVIDIGVGYYISKAFIEHKLSRKEWFELSICLIGILASGKRTIIIEIVVVAFLMLVLSVDRKKYLNFIKYGIALAVVSVLALALVPQARIAVTRFMDVSGDTTLNNRQAFWANALVLYSRNRMLGCGFASYSTYDLTQGTHFGYGVHNIYLEVMAELGIVGISIFGFFLVVTLLKACKKYREVNRYEDSNKLIIYFSMYAILTYILYGIMENVLYCFSLQYIFMIVLSILNSVKESRTNTIEKKRITGKMNI